MVHRKDRAFSGCVSPMVKPTLGMTMHPYLKYLRKYDFKICGTTVIDRRYN